MRAIQAHLKANGVDLIMEAEGQEGPTHMVLRDPDASSLLFDQF